MRGLAWNKTIGRVLYTPEAGSRDLVSMSNPEESTCPL
jgi:hypothetical protein